MKNPTICNINILSKENPNTIISNVHATWVNLFNRFYGSSNHNVPLAAYLANWRGDVSNIKNIIRKKANNKTKQRKPLYKTFLINNFRLIFLVFNLDKHNWRI